MTDKITLYSWKEITKILTEWADNQEQYANSETWMPDEAMREGYKRALKHLKYKLHNPITYII